MGERHPAVAYAHDVMDGSVPACNLVRLAVERQLRDLDEGPKRGLRFDRQAAEHAIQFFGFLKHSKGEWAGQPFVLSGWQQFVLWVLFGWKRADGLRRYRSGYIEVPRKNGKSSLFAGIGLYLTVADGEPGAEVYSAATKKDQAKILWSEAVRMRNQSPAMQRMVQYWKSSDNLSVDATASKFQPLGADSNTLDGLNAHGALIDELHAHPNRAVFDILDTATGARRQPLILSITTAGVNRATVCWEHREYTESLLKGMIEDDTWFGYITTIDEGDDWADPHVWAKANPNFGISVKPDDLQRKVDKAKRMPSALNSFLRLHLNVWTQQVDRWIPPALWAENGAACAFDEAGLAGRKCYGGLDLSAVSDITAWVLVFPHDASKADPEPLAWSEEAEGEEPAPAGPNPADSVDILCRFWCPESRLTDDTNKYHDQYAAWAAGGFLQVTPGNAVDYGFIKKQILEDASQYELVNLNVDRLFQGYQLSSELSDEGLTVFGMGQGFLSMAGPMKEFERRLLNRQLHHGNNPVLRWMADNVAVRRDPADNLKADKAASQGKIDGIVALVMALDRAMRANAERSAYDED